MTMNVEMTQIVVRMANTKSCFKEHVNPQLQVFLIQRKQQRRK